MVGGLSEMDLQLAQLLATLLIAAGAVANYVMLQSIKLEISRLSGELKEWARQTFADHDSVRRLEERVTDLEKR